MLIPLAAEDIPYNTVTDVYTVYQDAFITNGASSAF